MHKVLIVDDVRYMCDMIGNICKKNNLDVFVAESGDEAIKRLIEHPDIKIIFLDIVMPKMNGIQFLDALSKVEKLKNVPVIVTTANVSEKSVNAVKKYKVSSFLAKPVRVPQILELLSKHGLLSK